MTDKPNRVWRIAHSEASTGWGGQEHRIMAELTGFKRRGNEVWLLAPRKSQIHQRAAESNIPVQPLVVGRLAFPFAVVQTAAWLRRARVDILNTHSSRDGWIVGLAGRWARTRFVLRTRHFDVPVPNRWLSRHVYKTLCDHIVTTSPKVTAHFQELFGLPSERISTVPTGIDVELFSPTGPAAELLPGVESGRLPLIGMVSVLRRAKGHAVFLQAARLLSDAGLRAHYVIVGDGPARESIQKKIAELQLDDAVSLFGHREDIPAVLRALSVLAIPSLHEGIPQNGLQALATQIPVVASAVGGIPEIIRHGQTGRLVPPNNASALAQAIRETLENTQETEVMTKRGLALARTQHSLETMLDQLEQVYRRYLPD